MLAVSSPLIGQEELDAIKPVFESGWLGLGSTTYAFEKAVLREQDKDFYLQNWHRAHEHLTVGQKRYKEGLNQRIIRDLRAEFDL